jgi:hypothetical protein
MIFYILIALMFFTGYMELCEEEHYKNYCSINIVGMHPTFYLFC